MKRSSELSIRHMTVAGLLGGIAIMLSMTPLGVLSLILAFGYLPLSVVLGIAGTNGTAEIIISTLIVTAVVKTLEKSNSLK